MLLRHRNTFGAARALRLRRSHLIGHLHSLWHVALEQQEDGNLSSWSDDLIAEAADFPGDAPQLVRLLQDHGWLNGKILANWIDVAGKYLIKKYGSKNRGRLVEIWQIHGLEYGKNGENQADGLQKVSSKSPRRVNGEQLETERRPKGFHEDSLPPSSSPSLPHSPPTPPSCTPTLTSPTTSVPLKRSPEQVEDGFFGEEEPRRETVAEDVLQFLNAKAGREYRRTSDNLKLIAQRLSEVSGDVIGVKAMIERMCGLWKGDPHMDEYLRVTTLFRKSKFHEYYDNRNIPLITPKQGGRPESNQRAEYIEPPTLGL